MEKIHLVADENVSKEIQGAKRNMEFNLRFFWSALLQVVPGAL